MSEPCNCHPAYHELGVHAPGVVAPRPKKPEPEQLEIHVKVVADPAGERGVLLQLPFGYAIVGAAAARDIGFALIEAGAMLTEAAGQ